MSHTAAPWRVIDEVAEMDMAFVEMSDGTQVGGRDDCDVLSLNIADARLIAAAPELLSALKRVLAGFEANAFQRNTDGDGEPGWAIKFLPHLMSLADATRAIAKAEGK